MLMRETSGCHVGEGSEQSRTACVLLDALEVLQGEPKFPLALIPHLILFLAGDKPAVRVVLSYQVSAALRRRLEAAGYFATQLPIAITHAGPNWGRVEVSKGASPDPAYEILVISADPDTAARILDAELYGDSSESGLALGYPSCCVDAYPRLALHASNWPSALVAADQAESFAISMWCNRLASLWGGACPTGELYPCDLRCPNAIKLGRRADDLLRQHGFAELADEIKRQASRPIYLLDGEVVAGRPTDSNAREIRIDA